MWWNKSGRVRATLLVRLMALWLLVLGLAVSSSTSATAAATASMSTPPIEPPITEPPATAAAPTIDVAATTDQAATTSTETSSGTDVRLRIPAIIDDRAEAFHIGNPRCDVNGKSELDLTVDRHDHPSAATYVWVIGNPQVHARDVNAPGKSVSEFVLSGIPEGKFEVSIWNSNKTRKIKSFGEVYFACAKQSRFSVGKMACDSYGRNQLTLQVDQTGLATEEYLWVIGEPQIHARPLEARGDSVTTHVLSGIPDGAHEVVIWNRAGTQRVTELGRFDGDCDQGRTPSAGSAWIGEQDCLGGEYQGKFPVTITNNLPIGNSQRDIQFEVRVGDPNAVVRKNVTVQAGQTATILVDRIPSGVHNIVVNRGGRRFAELGQRSFTCDMRSTAGYVQPVLWISKDYAKRGINFNKYNDVLAVAKREFTTSTGGLSLKILPPITVYSNYTNYQAQCWGNTNPRGIPKDDPETPNVDECKSFWAVMDRDLERAGLRHGHSYSDGPALSIVAFGGGGHASGGGRRAIVGEYTLLPFFASCRSAIPAWPGDESAMRETCRDDQHRERGIAPLLHELGHALWDLAHLDQTHPSPPLRTLGNFYLMLNHGAYPATGWHDWELQKMPGVYTTGRYKPEAPRPSVGSLCETGGGVVEIKVNSSMSSGNGRIFMLINPYDKHNPIVRRTPGTTIKVPKSTLLDGVFFVRVYSNSHRASQHRYVDPANIGPC